MIHEILATDVEHARGMINSSHSDAEILANLVARGLDRAQAAQLVDDLRHGRQPSFQEPLLTLPGERHSSETVRAHREHAPSQYHAAPKPAQSARHRRAGLPWWFVLLILISIGALVYAFLEAGDEASKRAVDHDRHEIATPPGK